MASVSEGKKVAVEQGLGGKGAGDKKGRRERRKKEKAV